MGLMNIQYKNWTLKCTRKVCSLNLIKLKSHTFERYLKMRTVNSMKKVIPAQVGDGATCLCIHGFHAQPERGAWHHPEHRIRAGETGCNRSTQRKKGLTQAPEAKAKCPGTQSQVRQGQDVALPNKRSGICLYTAYCPWPGSCKQIRWAIHIKARDD